MYIYICMYVGAWMYVATYIHTYIKPKKQRSSLANSSDRCLCVIKSSDCVKCSY